MLNKTLMMKLIAVILVLMLSLSNFLVLVSYAAEISVGRDIDLASQDAETNNKNIKFDSYFRDENGNKTYSKKLDILSSNKVYLDINLSNNGYLKTGTINFEEENFNIIRQDETVSTIQNIDYDKKEIKLNQVNAGTELELEIPIEIAKSELYDVQNLNKNNKVLFTGIYVTSKGKEIEIEKEIFLNLQWDAEAEGVVEQNLSKYIDIDDETLIEFDLKTSLNQNILPVKETILELDVPVIEEKLPKYVKVIANSIASTGDLNGLNFGDSNYEYSKEENKIKINVQNLANEQSVVQWKNGLDEYKVILIYDKLSQDEKSIVINSKAIFDVYGKTDKLEKAINNEITLNESIGNVNEVSVTTETPNIYKSFIYANSEYETEYRLNWDLEVGYAKVSDKLVVQDVGENFVDNDSAKTMANTYYKQTIINKKNFEKILGQDGFIKILNEANEEIANVTFGMGEEENIIINYENTDLNKIKIETSKPIEEGTLEIKHIKRVKAQTDLEKEKVKTFVNLENEVNLITTYKKVSEQEDMVQPEEIEVTNLNVVNSINLLEPETKIEVKTNKESLVTGSSNDDTEIYINLINNKEEYSLYSNPIFDIKLPEEIDYVQLKDVKLVFEDELQVQNTELIEDENGIKHIRITLTGAQTKYNIGSIITGPNLIITSDIGLKNIVETKLSEIEVICTNEDITASAKTGINLVKVEVPEQENPELPEVNEELEQEPVETPEISEPEQEPEQEPENETVESDKVGVTISSNKEAGEVIRWGEIVKYTVNLKNNGENVINNIALIGYIPDGAVYTTTDEREVFGPIEYTDKYEVENVKWNIEKIESGETITKEYEVRYLKNNQENVEVTANAKAIIGETEIESNTAKNILEKAYVQINMDCNVISDSVVKDDSVKFYIRISEIYGENLENAKFKFNMPNGTICEDAYIIYYSEEKQTFLYDREGFEVGDNQIEKSISLESYETLQIEVILKIEDPYKIESGFLENRVEVRTNEMVNYSNSFKIPVDKPILEVRQMSSLPEGEIEKGSILKYIIQIKNTGNCTAKNVKLTDIFPSNSMYLSTERYIGTEKVDCSNFANGKATTAFNLPAGEIATCVVTVETLGKAQQSLENTVKVSAKGIDEIEANKLTHTVVEAEKLYSNENSQENGNNSVSSENKKCSISGTAWKDVNGNGIREIEEKKLSGIDVLLLNANNEITNKVQTNSSGTYKFEGLNNGKYKVVFVYNTNTYAITKYNVQTDYNINSDAIPTKITLDGKEQTVGITDNINIEGSNINNIDIGLVQNPKFDLKLEKYVDEIIVKTAKGEKVYDYNNTKLAKIEFASKEIENSSVEITYVIRVTNEGQVEGYATKIVDYIPQELSFDKAKNHGWYQGENGEVYTNALENIQILPGETKEIRLVLNKTMSGEDTGIVNNNAEIYSSHNSSGLQDVDSTYGNNKNSEDDQDYANVYLGIKTGKTILYISLIISQIIILGVGIYLIKTKVLEN